MKFLLFVSFVWMQIGIFAQQTPMNWIQNQPLSEKRAHTIAQYLQRKGIDVIRIQKKGLGATQPISDNQTVEGREKNRRVEIETN